MKITPTDYARAYLAAIARAAAAERVQVTRNLWQAVWRRGHFTWAKRIVEQVHQLLRQQAGTVVVEVVTSRALSEAQQGSLRRDLARAVGKPVELACAVKPHLLGGVVVTWDDRRYDASVKGRLEALYRALAGESSH
ncbi:MAG: ATP synthase F1 subunit delta [Candidatus Veblenbacteria bacterium]|nr:ATP synthase F1 subunit delta [Candidatus Veblenbacteria bacterium]MDZ4229852.1 ATP synthase F1 subunit delta [Candidatus Veblenbacteria bacterium]